MRLAGLLRGLWHGGGMDLGAMRVCGNKWQRRAAVGVVVAVLVAAAMMRMFYRLPEPKPLPWRFRKPSVVMLATIPSADRFDWPIGSMHGGLAYNAQAFGVRDVSPLPHLGDDLNGVYGYNTDLGDPVRAVANGLVIGAGRAGRGWGKVIAVVHAMPGEGGMRRYVQSFYAHLDRVFVRRGEIVVRGQRIGTIGTADGLYYAHLHFEMRDFANPWIGRGYREDLSGWLNPIEFLERNRGAADDDLRLEPAPVGGQEWNHGAALRSDS